MFKCPTTDITLKQCPLTSCKYWTERTSRRCMAVDVQVGDRGFTTADLQYFKMPEAAIKDVNAARKAALEKANAILCLYACIDTLNDVRVYTPSPHLLDYDVYRIPELMFKPHMLKWCCDSTYWPYLSKHRMHLLYGMTDDKYQTYCREVQHDYQINHP